MTNQIAEQKRLAEILKLARLQLNDEYMKQHSAAHTAWIANARIAWTTNGTLLPFTTKFVYPTEEEVVARGVEIYNTLTQKAPAEVVKPKTELIQAGGDFVVADVTEAEIIEEPVVEAEPEPELEDKFKSLFTKWGGRGNY